MSKSRLLLLVNSNENRRLLVNRLTPMFEVVFPSQADLDCQAIAANACDLIILDLVELGNWQSTLSACKQAAEPLFLPVLVLMPQSTIGTLPLDLRYQIDELVTAPVDPDELEVRIKILLRTRSLSRSLATQNEQLEEMNTLKSRFVSVVSHEFRNPLSVISGMVQLLQRREQSLPSEKKQGMFGRIQNSVSKLTILLDDLLILDRNASSQVSFNPKFVALESYCQKLLSDLRTSNGATREIQLQVQGDAADVYVDTELIETILSNLLSNALKYSPGDRPVSLRLKYLPSQVAFEIQDQGRGIPEEDQSALFEAFFRARNVGATPGTGLGLSIVKQCVDLHRGTIAVQSQVGQGTTFVVTLPSEMDSELFVGDTIDHESFS